MRARHWLFCVTLLGLASAASAQQGIRWQTNFETAAKSAVQSNRLILLHFWSDACSPCVKMEREVFSRSDVALAVETNYIPIKVNVRQYPNLAERYGVTAWPTDLVLSPRGEVIDKNTGFVPAQQYVLRLNQIAAKMNARPGFTQVAETSPGAAMRPAQPPYGPPAGPAMAARSPVGTTPEGYATPPWQQGYPQPSMASGPAPQIQASARTPMNPQPVNPQPIGPQPMPGQPSPTPWPANTPAARPEAAGVASRDFGASQSGYGARPTLDRPPAIPLGPNPAAVREPPVIGAGRPSVSREEPRREAASVARPPVVDRLPPGNPPLALDGYCPVSLSEKERWVKGNTRFGVIHAGRTYLFAGPEEARRFYDQPEKFAPAAAGNDIVLSVEQGQVQPGRREHGAWLEGRVYLFATEETYDRFRRDPTKYLGVVNPSATNTAQRPAMPPAAPNGPAAASADPMRDAPQGPPSYQGQPPFAPSQGAAPSWSANGRF